MKQITFRVVEEDYALLKEAAWQRRVPLAVWLRTAAMEALRVQQNLYVPDFSEIAERRDEILNREWSQEEWERLPEAPDLVPIRPPTPEEMCPHGYLKMTCLHADCKAAR